MQFGRCEFLSIIGKVAYAPCKSLTLALSYVQILAEAFRLSRKNPRNGLMKSSTGLKIKERRKALGVTQAALAEEVGVSPSYLNLIENGKRPIGGRILIRIARALGAGLDELDDAEERRLVAALREVAAEPLLRDVALSTERLAELVALHPDWARGVVKLHRAYADRDRVADALSDRLNQDPVLSERVHQLLSHASAIRSASEILADIDDMPVDQSRRFHGMLLEESGRLSNVSRALASFFEKSESDRLSTTPAEEIDDFLQARGNYFPELEDEAERLRFAAQLDDGDGVEGALRRFLHARGALGAHEETDADGADVSSVDDETPEPLARAVLTPDAVGPSRRFALARMAAGRALEERIAAVIDEDERIQSAAAAERARLALANYAAAAMLMPYARFHQAALELRYDVDALANRFAVSYEQAAHRLATLQRPGAQGLPFAFMRADPSGFVSKRFALPTLPLPRRGWACPLWAVYRAFQTPFATIRQLVEMPDGGRFLFIAKAMSKGGAVFEEARHLVSVLIACDAVHADQTVYGAGLDMASAEAVGATCRLCPRMRCSARQEEELVASPEERKTRRRLNGVGSEV